MPATLPEAYHDNILQSILKKNSHNEKGQSALKKTLEKQSSFCNYLANPISLAAIIKAPIPFGSSWITGSLK